MSTSRNCVFEERVYEGNTSPGTSALEDVSRYAQATSSFSNVTWQRLPSGIYVRKFASSGLVYITHHISLNHVGAISLECWVNSASLGASEVIIQKGGAGGVKDWPYGVRLSSGDVVFGIGDGSGSDYLTGSQTLVINTWNHIVAQADGSDLYVYVNGLVAKSISQTKTPANNSSTFNMGSATFTNGLQWGVRMRNKVLTPDQIYARFQATRGLFDV